MAEYMEGILGKAEGKVSSGGKPYYLIEVAGDRATSWDKKVNKILPELLGQKVSAEYTTSDDGEFRNVTHVEALGQTGASPRAPEQPQQPAQPAQPPGDRVCHVTPKDVVIARQSSLRTASELAAVKTPADVIAAAQLFESWVLDGFCIPDKLDRGREVPDDVPF